MPSAKDVVDAINDISGSHAGHRAAHAKGIVCAGTFTASPGAKEISRAAHLQGEPVRTTVRLSNGGGDPTRPDAANDGRGLSVKFYLPDGSRTDIVAITLPVFFVRNPEDFLAFTRARKPDPETGQPDLDKVGAFLAEHPEAVPAIQFQLGMAPPASRAQLRYYGIHAFRFLAAGGEARYGRYRLEPEAGEAWLDPEAAEAQSADYLEDELRERMAAGPVSFALQVQLAEEGDATDDPSVQWPEEREIVELGRLEITGLDPEREQGDDVLVFDPTRVTDGIECSGDPILSFRPLAYSESVARRTAPATAAGAGGGPR
jgi:catalase